MGTYSTTIFCKTNDAKHVATVLHSTRRSAFVLPPKQGYVLVYDQECDDDDEVVGRISSHLSRELGAVIIAVINYDDDLLEYYLYVRGSLRDHYSSSSAHSDEWEIGRSVFGSTSVLCEVFNKPRSGKRLENILLSTDYIFESERYAALSKILGLPYNYAQLSYWEIAGSVNAYEMASKGIVLLTRFQLREIGGFDLPLRTYVPEREVQALVRRNLPISAIDLYRREKKCSLQEAHAYVMSLKH